jgi:SAM-dependent methyltransferase
MLQITRRIVRKLSGLVSDKYDAELSFWRWEIDRYVAWYRGEVSLYCVAPPTSNQKTTQFGQPLDAIETWLRVSHLGKYPDKLLLRPEALTGLRVLDIGCGPFPGLLAFSGCAVKVGVDPLVTKYEQIGFPLGRWSDGYLYCQTRAETLPFPSHSFDAVVSVNAMDHVDDFAMVAREVQRVLRPGGNFCTEVHYHKRQVTEPVELDDEVFVACYGWVDGLRKARERTSVEHLLPGEKLVLWTNMDHET